MTDPYTELATKAFREEVFCDLMPDIPHGQMAICKNPRRVPVAFTESNEERSIGKNAALAEMYGSGEQKAPDARKHYLVSMFKSVLRIFGYGFMIGGFLRPVGGTFVIVLGLGLLFLAEVLGIFEETV